jgi:hypothetical protein
LQRYDAAGRAKTESHSETLAPQATVKH